MNQERYNYDDSGLDWGDEGLSDVGQDDEELDRVIRELFKFLASHGGTQNTEGLDESYKFFPYQEERDELYEYSKRVAEYLHDNDVANLVVIDRSSRPLYVGVLEYWRAKYGDKKKPGMYFMNPKGFKPKEELSPEEIEDVCWEAEMKGDVSEHPSQIRSRDEILAELRERYHRLMEDKDKPLLVFDSCIHSGDTLSPVKDGLEREGFSDITIGSVNAADSNSKVPTDFHITDERPEKGCYPFDRDRMIEKTFDHVYSRRTQSKRKSREATQLRREIKRVMQERLESEIDS